MSQTNYSLLCMDPNEVTVVIYHAKCYDGFCSALCAYLFNKNIKFYEGIYDGEIPNVENECVLICDFSYKKEIMDKLLQTTKKLVILDHHKSALDELQNIPNENKIFDLDHSGAYLTWQYFFPNQSIPKLIEHVQDNDLWIRKMEYTKEIISYLSSMSFDFVEYQKLLVDANLNNAINLGKKIMEDNDKYIQIKVKEAQSFFLKINDKYYIIPHVQSYTNKSEIGHTINETIKNIDCCAIYSYNKETNKTNFSLRSNDQNMDTTEISLIFGGGGHRNASGFSLTGSHNHIPGTLIDKNIHRIFNNNIVFKNVQIDGRNYISLILKSNTHKDKIGQYLLQKNNVNIAIIWNERKDNKTFMITIVARDNNVLNAVENFLKNKVMNLIVKDNILNCSCSIENNIFDF